MITVINDSNFEEKVEKNEGIVLVDFFATWCGPCKMLSPILEELSNELEGKVSFCKVDVDENPMASSSYKIQYMPTLMIFKNGEVKETIIGFNPKEVLMEKLQGVL